MRLFVLPLSVICFCTAMLAQNGTLDSYRKAREVLDRSIGIYGGLEKIRGIENFTIKASGSLVLRNQSRRPFALERAPWRIEITVDLKSKRFLEEELAEFPSGNKPHESLIVDGEKGVNIDHVRQTRYDRTKIPSSEFRLRLRWLPHFVVLSAIDNVSSIRYAGTSIFESRPHDVVIFDADGEEVTLLFDKKTSLLSKYETLVSDSVVGDAVTETIFSDYKNENGSQFPHTKNIRIAGELTQEVRYDQLEVNNLSSKDNFKGPDGLRTVTLPSTRPFIKLSDNAYVLNVSGYNILAIGFVDYILVVEAPLADSVSLEAIERVRKLFPGKPIRYVTATHHHEDHTGGIRTYIAEGATLIVAPGERSFFEALARSNFTLNPDTLARRPRAVKIEHIIDGKRVFSDDRTAVEIYDVGQNMHSDEMLVVYLPKEKVLFTADMLNRPPNGDVVLGNLLTMHLEKWITDKKLPVEQIMPVHGTITSIDELRKANSDFQRQRTRLH